MAKSPQKQVKSSKYDRLKPWQFQPGKSGNPGGKKKGTVSLKTYAKKMLEGMNEKEAVNFLKGIDKKVVWEMAEGKPEAKVGGTLTITAASVLFDDIHEGTEGEDTE